MLFALIGYICVVIGALFWEPLVTIGFAMMFGDAIWSLENISTYLKGTAQLINKVREELQKTD